MGSPYSVHTHINRTHVVRSSKGFERILKVIASSMDAQGFLLTPTDDCNGPEQPVINDLWLAYNQAVASRSRVVVFLEARYEWRGWEKFQRVVIFDFSRKGE